MELETRYGFIGAAVLLGMALLVGGLLWLGGKDARGKHDRYHIVFSKNSLEGMQRGSSVLMKGIRVGSVIGYRIDSADGRAVSVDIQVDDGTPVRKSTRAAVSRQLITGQANVVLENPAGDSSSPDMEVVGGDQYPLIAEGESNLLKLQDTASRVIGKAEDTLGNLGEFASAENRRVFNEMLVNLRDISGNVARGTRHLDTTVQSLDALARDLRRAGVQIAASATTIQTDVHSVGRSATAALDGASVSIRTAGGDLSRVADRIETLAEVSRAELAQTTQRLRSTVDAVGTAARRLQQPREVLFGPEMPPGPGEKR